MVYKRKGSTKTKDHKPKRKSKGKTSKDSSSEDTCWTCGKKGHRSNLCPRNKKKKKKISLFKVEEIKNKLFSILEEEESESYSETTLSNLLKKVMKNSLM